MKNRFKLRAKVLAEVLAVWTAVLLLAGTLAVSVSAAYVEATKCLVIVSQHVTGEVATDTYQYLLVPDDTDVPMPDGAGTDGYVFSLKGNDKVSISITYAKPGIYDYKLYQLKADGQPNPEAEVYDFGMIVKNGTGDTLDLTPYTCENDNLILHENGVECNYTIQGTVTPETTTQKQTSVTQTRTNVNTNDDSNIGLWFSLLAVGFIGFFAVLFVLLGRKKQTGGRNE